MPETDTATSAPVAEVLATAVAAGGGETRDDIAVLVVQVREPALDRREKAVGGIFDTGTMS